MAKTETGFLDRIVKSGGKNYRFSVYIPLGWTPKKKWPVVLFLHGGGEGGTDGLKSTLIGLPTAIRQNRDRFPCVVVSPQCLRKHNWNEPKMIDQALAALEQSVREFHGDRKRLILTGLSMGGYGSWAILPKHPNLFAAAAIICGGIRPPDWVLKQRGIPLSTPMDHLYVKTAQGIRKGMPIWVFHGDRDGAVPVTESRRMVKELSKLKKRVFYTEYKGVGHNSWDLAYDDKVFIGKLLSQKLSN